MLTKLKHILQILNGKLCIFDWDAPGHHTSAHNTRDSGWRVLRASEYSWKLKYRYGFSDTWKSSICADAPQIRSSFSSSAVNECESEALPPHIHTLFCLHSFYYLFIRCFIHSFHLSASWRHNTYVVREACSTSAIARVRFTICLVEHKHVRHVVYEWV